MGWWLLGKPRWVRGILMGLLFGVLYGLFFVREHGWLAGIIGGVLAGAAFGIVMTLVRNPAHSLTLSAAGPLDGDDLEAAVRAVRRGPDPETSTEALVGARRMVQYQLDALEDQRRITLLLFVGGSVALVAVAAVTRSWWWVLLAAAWIAIAVRQLTAPRRLRVRLAALEMRAPGSGGTLIG